MKPEFDKIRNKIENYAGLPIEMHKGKRVLGSARVKHPGQKAANFYHFDDGTEAMEEDSGAAVTKWPTPKKKAKA